MLQIKDAIQSSGMTLQAISDSTHISVPALSNLMSAGNPTAETLQKIADATGKPIVISPRKKIPSSADFSTHIAWLRHSIAGMDIILSKTSALEYMGLFPGYMYEHSITAYAASDPHIEGLDITVRRLRKKEIIGHATSFSRTVNDILASDEDRQPLIEALSEWLCTGQQEPDIDEENQTEYEDIKMAALDYYDGGYDD